MSDKGWIALHRNIRDHWVYQKEYFQNMKLGLIC